MTYSRLVRKEIRALLRIRAKNSEHYPEPSGLFFKRAILADRLRNELLRLGYNVPAGHSPFAYKTQLRLHKEKLITQLKELNITVEPNTSYELLHHVWTRRVEELRAEQRLVDEFTDHSRTVAFSLPYNKRKLTFYTITPHEFTEEQIEHLKELTRNNQRHLAIRRIREWVPGIKLSAAVNLERKLRDWC